MHKPWGSVNQSHQISHPIFCFTFFMNTFFKSLIIPWAIFKKDFYFNKIERPFKYQERYLFECVPYILITWNANFNTKHELQIYNFLKGRADLQAFLLKIDFFQFLWLIVDCFCACCQWSFLFCNVATKKCRNKNAKKRQIL